MRFVSKCLILCPFFLESFGKSCKNEDDFLMGEKCYTLVNTPEDQNWFEAENYCVENFDGGHLASIHSYEEDQVLFSYIEQVMEYHVFIWIGLKRNDPHSDWKWSDGSVTNYTHWADHFNPDEDLYAFMDPAGDCMAWGAIARDNVEMDFLLCQYPTSDSPTTMKPITTIAPGLWLQLVHKGTMRRWSRGHRDSWLNRIGSRGMSKCLHNDWGLQIIRLH